MHASFVREIAEAAPRRFAHDIERGQTDVSNVYNTSTDRFVSGEPHITCAEGMLGACLLKTTHRLLS